MIVKSILDFIVGISFSFFPFFLFLSRRDTLIGTTEVFVMDLFQSQKTLISDDMFLYVFSFCVCIALKKEQTKHQDKNKIFSIIQTSNLYLLGRVIFGHYCVKKSFIQWSKFCTIGTYFILCYSCFPSSFFLFADCSCAKEERRFDPYDKASTYILWGLQWN